MFLKKFNVTIFFLLSMLCSSLQAEAGNFFEDAGRAVNKAVEDVNRTVNKAGEDINRTVNKAGEDVNRTVNKAGEDTNRTVNKAGEDINSFAESAWKVVASPLSFIDGYIDSKIADMKNFANNLNSQNKAELPKSFLDLFGPFLIKTIVWTGIAVAVSLLLFFGPKSLIRKRHSTQ